MVLTIELFGIPVYFETWGILIGLLVAAYILYQIGKQVRANCRKEEYGRKFLLISVLIFLTIIFSILVHETAHALVSRFFGIKIIEAGFIGIGAYVRSAVSVSTLPFYVEMLVAFAGPASNLVLAAAATIAAFYLSKSFGKGAFMYISDTNYMLAKLNLIPFFLFDGGRVLHGFFRIFVADINFAWDLVLYSFVIYLGLRLFWVKYKSNEKTVQDL